MNKCEDCVNHATKDPKPDICKHFEAKVEYVYLDKIWERWEKEGVTEKEFEAALGRNTSIEIKGSDGSWSTNKGSLMNAARLGIQDCIYYRIPKDKVPPMPEIIIPDCPHCGSKGEIDNMVNDCAARKFWWYCSKPGDTCLHSPEGFSPREAIALFHKYIKTEKS